MKIAFSSTTSAGLMTAVKVIGAQSGTVYQPLIAGPSGVFYLVVPLLGSPLPDQSLIVQNTTTSGTVMLALQGGGAPSFAELYQTSSVANSGVVLAAPAAGAYYVFGIDSIVAAADIQQFRDGAGVNFANTEVAVGGQEATTGPLGPVRVATSIRYFAVGVNQNDQITIRYSLGP